MQTHIREVMQSQNSNMLAVSSAETFLKIQKPLICIFANQKAMIQYVVARTKQTQHYDRLLYCRVHTVCITGNDLLVDVQSIANSRHDLRQLPGTIKVGNDHRYHLGGHCPKHHMLHFGTQASLFQMFQQLIISWTTCRPFHTSKQTQLSQQSYVFLLLANARYEQLYTVQHGNMYEGHTYGQGNNGPHVHKPAWHIWKCSHCTSQKNFVFDLWPLSQTYQEAEMLGREPAQQVPSQWRATAQWVSAAGIESGWSACRYCNTKGTVRHNHIIVITLQ